MAVNQIKLNSLRLPIQTRWVEKTQSNNIYAEVSEGLTGHKVVRSGRITSGLLITLSCGRGDDIFTHDQVNAIQAMHDVIGATYPLEMDGRTYQVRFAHENKPAWEYTGFWNLIDPAADIGFNGTIKLITV